MPKRLQGIVVSHKQNKTVVVDIERKFRHPLYKKIVKRNKRYQVHVEGTAVQRGDKVIIEETRPISKLKHFKIVGKHRTQSEVADKSK